MQFKLNVCLNLCEYYINLLETTFMNTMLCTKWVFCLQFFMCQEQQQQVESGAAVSMELNVAASDHRMAVHRPRAVSVPAHFLAVDRSLLNKEVSVGVVDTLTDSF